MHIDTRTQYKHNVLTVSYIPFVYKYTLYCVSH